MALFHFLVLGFFIAFCKVDATKKILLNEQNNFTTSHSTMRQVNNDVDCVDIYKQPALQHPLLKNHKIQLYPTFAKNSMRRRPSYDGECPAGKVPIYKSTRRHQIVTDLSSKLPIEDFWHYAQSTNHSHTVSLDTTQNNIFYGGYAVISLYNLSLTQGQYSTSSIWVESGPPDELNSIHVGIGFRPDIYGDSQLRLTTLWTALGNSYPGCSDSICHGFIQVTQDELFVPGVVLSPSSRVGAPDKYFLTVRIQRDQSTGNWWLIINEKVQVGYWPKELFTYLRKGASKVRFGGETYASPNLLSPPMGSGRLPTDGYQYSALFGRLQHIDSDSDRIDVIPEYMKSYNDAKKDCYDLKFYEHLGNLYRRAFLYGGPGGHCDN